ncbi:MAG: peptidylprolyl isomerase [Calditrichia bacterium]
MDTLIVASVGPLDITAREFLLSYEYGPAFYKRMKEPQRKFLDFMINEKLLALEGFDEGVEKEERATEMLSQIEGDLITEQLFREDVMSRVNISEEELRKAIEREKVNLKVRWLYTDSFREMQRQSQDLKNGIPFDSLFVRQLHDSIKIDDCSLEDSRFRIELKNPDLSKILDTLSYGTVSPPIQTPDGWYFVKIEDSWVNAITTESEAFALRKRVKDALFKYKMDVLSDQYVREMMSDADPVIVRNTFDLLQNYLAQKYLPPEKLADWNLTGQVLEEFGPINVGEIDAFGEKQLVRIRKGEINLRDFLIWYRTRENYIKLSYASRKSFFISLQQVVWRMVRDHLLVERAEQRGFQDREIVRKQKLWWKSKIAFSIAREEIGQSSPMTEDELLH